MAVGAAPPAAGPHPCQVCEQWTCAMCIFALRWPVPGRPRTAHQWEGRAGQPPCHASMPTASMLNPRASCCSCLDAP